MRRTANFDLVMALIVWAVILCLLLSGCASDRVSRVKATYQPESHSVSVELELSR